MTTTFNFFKAFTDDKVDDILSFISLNPNFSFEKNQNSLFFLLGKFFYLHPEIVDNFNSNFFNELTVKGIIYAHKDSPSPKSIDLYFPLFKKILDKSKLTNSESTQIKCLFFTNLKKDQPITENMVNELFSHKNLKDKQVLTEKEKIAISFIKNSHIEEIFLLKIPINTVLNIYDSTLLHHLCFYSSNLNDLETFAKYNPDITILNHFQHSPFTLLLENKKFEMAFKFLQVFENQVKENINQNINGKYYLNHIVYKITETDPKNKNFQLLLDMFQFICSLSPDTTLRSGLKSKGKNIFEVIKEKIKNQTLANSLLLAIDSIKEQKVINEEIKNLLINKSTSKINKI